ncbi:DUF3429 domain-containing protein [Ideonella sp. A 288]|uniref:DUF3429 domain-containing protein n=1 Tax=Ideonella sp. A 288 TaxID=1962181 RepID=UPI000B4C1927|nr:DUF3429 domain-containing protein [Ideonella sp. A 288]
MNPALTTTAPPSDTAHRLGQAGLVPFVLGAALVWLVDERAHGYVTLGLSVYAALVVSFLGGIHWGIGFVHADPPPTLFVWGVVPSMLSWVAVMMPPGAGLVVNGVMLVACYLVDRKVYPPMGLSRWLTLRFRLSSLAAFCCFLGAAGA